MSVDMGSRRPKAALSDILAFRPSGTMLAGTLAFALALGAGWWLGGVSRDEASAPAPATFATVGDLRLELAPAWVRADPAPGLPIADAEVFAPAPGVAARAVFVTGPAGDATLMPAVLRAELPAALPAPRRARLAGLAAWTFGPLRDGSQTLDITVAPTTAGTFALVCTAPHASWIACGDDVHAIDTGTAEALTPTLDLAFRQVAGPVLEALDRRRVAGRARLAGARRAKPARALAETHRAAARALAPFAAVGATADAVAALRGAARGYHALAAAGRRRDRARFMTARRAVQSADAALAAALSELRR